MPQTFGIQAKKNWLVLLFDPHARIMNMPLNIIIGKVKKKNRLTTLILICFVHPKVGDFFVSLLDV